MSCIPASHSMNNILTQVEPQLEESPGERRGSRAYQIFPEVNKDEDSCPENILYRRERLPSIVVEPTELEGGSTRWPKLCPSGSSLEEGEETGCSADPTEQDSTAEPDSGARKSSLTPSQSQMSLSHLTPPTSPTPPEAAPPCLRS
ncbi:protein LBH-like isoform X2 [Takifugu flavidus]|uniref:protein LBH-like isoform X2 n=1 Tax=Takifugu flavidus TaxID=433684 RepID=UPI0025442D43|nr:protein LBH-like isoform X2 [Takifugu flavidus]